MARQQGSPCEDLLRSWLDVVLIQMGAASEPDDAVVPELFSGNCRAPLWFVGENPAGNGQRPTLAPVRQDWNVYTDFYIGRFRNLPLDITGEELSPTNRNYAAYVRAFCEAAGLSPAECQTYLMKTNAFGAHAPKKKRLQDLANQYPLDEWVGQLVRKCRPKYVVGIGRAGHELVERLRQEYLLDTSTEFYSFKSAPGWRRSPDCMNLMRRLGEQWAQGDR